MIVRKSALMSATILTAVSAVFWVGSAIGAPRPPAYLHTSAVISAPTMPEPGVADTNLELAPNLQRQVVGYPTSAAAGTIIIDTANTYLYFVLGDGRAIRYGIGVGRDGFRWSGSQSVTRMAEWPDWTPPNEMIVRQPYLPRWMAGGRGNPLGARAIYLGSTEYRIHGTNAPQTIGTRVSSGCIRLINADVMDLYSRVTLGTTVIVLANHGQIARSVAPVRAAAPRSAHLRTTGIY